jgi:hypothetical protein
MSPQARTPHTTDVVSGKAAAVVAVGENGSLAFPVQTCTPLSGSCMSSPQSFKTMVTSMVFCAFKGLPFKRTKTDDPVTCICEADSGGFVVTESIAAPVNVNLNEPIFELPGLKAWFVRCATTVNGVVLGSNVRLYSFVY